MFTLSPEELERAKAAINAHGYSIFFPHPPEWETALANWEALKAHLAVQDLDLYQPREPLRTFAPKSRINLRPVALLHPYDLLIYTALTLIVRDEIEAGRIPVSERRVFSHRSEPDLAEALYEPSKAPHEAYRARQFKRASRPACRTVAVTDVADFFPRIYQHRLSNIIPASQHRSE